MISRKWGFCAGQIVLQGGTKTLRKAVKSAFASKPSESIKPLWRWMKRRAAIEPGTGHLKREHRMDRNRLKGRLGDCTHAILSAVGMNFAKPLKRAAALLRLIFAWILNSQRAPFFQPGF